MPALRERYPTACDFEDIALYDPKSARASRKGSEISDHTLRHSQGSSSSASSRSSSQEMALPGASLPSMDPHSSFQSINSDVSTPTLASDTSSLRSSLSSISSPTLTASHFHQQHVPPIPEKAPTLPVDPHTTTNNGRRKSVPALVDNTSMASLSHLPSFRAQHRSYATRTRKQRELDFDRDEGEDIWPGGGLMFNVPMSPALYAQQQKQLQQQQMQQHEAHHAQHHPSSLEDPHQRAMRSAPPGSQHRKSYFSNTSRNKSLPAIHEQRFERDGRRPSAGDLYSMPPAMPPSATGSSTPRSTSVGSLDLLQRLSINSSIEGLDPDASDLTLELYRLEEAQDRRRLSEAGGAANESLASMVTLDDGEDMLPLPNRKRGSDNDSVSSGDSRRSSLTRPENLPPKDPEEERKHLKEYEKLMKESIAAEKRKQQKREEEAKQRAHQEKLDEGVWTSWLSKSRKPRLSSDLKWRGIPGRVRGDVWVAQTGADLSSLPAPKEVMTEEIAKDAEYVWPECGIFGPERPLHGSLIRVVQRFLAKYPEIEYQFSLASIAGLLLLHLDEPESAAVMIKLISSGSLVHSVLTNNEQLASANYVSFVKVYESKFQLLSQHFTKVGLSVSEFMNPLVAGLFSTVLPTPELAARILDVYIFEGDSFLLRTGLGLLRTNEAWLYVSKEEALEHLEDARVSSDDAFMQAVRDVTKSH